MEEASPQETVAISARSPDEREGSMERTRDSSLPQEEPLKEDGTKQEARNKRFGPPSPTADQPERRAKRRRSVSPQRRDNDLYRPDYRRDDGPPPRRGPGRGGHGPPRDDFRSGDGHFNPRFGNGGPPPPPRLPPPEDLPYLVSFRQFSDFHRDIRSPVAESREALDAAFLKYRNDFTARQLGLFFEEHRTRAWFKERYDPGMEELRARVKAQGREGKVDQFLASLGANVLSDLSYDMPVASSTVETKGETTKEDDAPVEADGDGDVKMGNEEEKPVEEDVTAAGPASEATVETSPEKAEKADPSLPSKPEHKDTREEYKEDEFVLIQPVPNQLFIKSLSPDIERVMLEKHCSAVDGYTYVALSEPNHMRRYQRVGWIAFQPGTDMQVALSQLGESKLSIGDNEQFTLHMHLSGKPTYQRLRVAPGPFSEKERLEKDLQQASQLAKRLEGELGDSRGSVAIDAHFSTLREAAQEAMAELPEESKAVIMAGIVKRELDATLFYLRNVFNTCYYCTCICDFPEELLQRCAKHVRRPVGMDAPKPKGVDPKKRYKPNDQAFMRRLDERVALLINPEDADPREHGGKNPEEELRRICLPHIKVEDQSKFRCQVEGCGKAFKGSNFAEKHIANKHGDLIEPQLQRLRYFNNYVLDPDRILPPAPDAPPLMGGGGFNGPPQGMPYMPNAGGFGGPHHNGEFGSPPGMHRGGRGRGPPRGGAGGGPRFERNDRARREAHEARERMIDTLPPPAPPKGAQLDPRAGRQRSTYEDLDSAGPPSGELDLQY